MKSSGFFNTILLLCMLVVPKILISQNIILNEDFERKYVYDWKDLESSSKIYVIDPYISNQKAPLTIYSNRIDSPYNKCYAENVCPDIADKKHGFYAGIKTYFKGVPSDRELLVIKLDVPMERDNKYQISFESKYNKCSKYKTDSLQVFIAESEKDISLFLSDGEFKGLYLSFSIESIDNKKWQKVTFDCQADFKYKFIMIGNLKRDENTTLSKLVQCGGCAKKDGGLKVDSEIFVDNILILESR